MGNVLFSRSNNHGSHQDETDFPTSSSPKEINSSPEKQYQTAADTIVQDDIGTRPPSDVAAETTASRPLGLSSLPSTMEKSKRKLETPTAGGSSREAGHSGRQDKPPTDEGTTKPSGSSTVSSTTSGCVSKQGSHSEQGYLKKMSRQERRKIEQDIKRKRRPGMFVWHMDKD